MLHLPQTLPSGALIGGESRALAKVLARTGGARFMAREADLVRSGDAITGWREASGAIVATTTVPNSGFSRFDVGPPAALICRTGVHCGFVLSVFAPEVSRFTAAIIYSSQGEAKSLLSVSTGQSNNLVFLSESEGQLSLKDRQGTLAVALDLPGGPAKPHLAVLSFTGRALILRLGQRIARAEGSLPAMGHPGDFFIGCRSNRSGLAKTLGASRLHEVLFWPDRALLGSPDPEDAATLAALDAYHRWTF
jgi:hypothetical protein